MQDVTRRAIEAIGPDDPEHDGTFNPIERARDLPDAAGPLRRVLERADVRGIMEEFGRDDARATAAQKTYKRVAHAGLCLATFATVVGSLFLLPVEEWFGSSSRIIGLVLQFSALAGAVAASRFLYWRKPFDTWMKARGKAEIARIGLFNTLIGAEEPQTGNEIALLPLKLEYFRRYQLGVQCRYYSGQGEKHQKSAGATRVWKFMSIVVTVAAGLIIALGLIPLLASWGVPLPGWISDVGVSSRYLSPEWSERALLAAGAISSAFYSFAASRSLINLDERNASRYRTNAENLKFLAETGLADARNAAAEGRVEDVFAFVSSVQSIVSSEHKEWVLLRELAPKADPRLAQTWRTL